MGKRELTRDKRPAVFLDRDGVLNKPRVWEGRPYPPALVKDFAVYDDAAAGCSRLKAAGFLLVVVSNQPDVGRGRARRADIDEMNRQLFVTIPALDHIETCFHAGEQHGQICKCRKPRPGMLLRSAELMKIDLARSFLIGDRWRDVDCARAAGCKAIFIDRGYTESLRQQPDVTVTSFAEAAQAVLEMARFQCLASTDDLGLISSRMSANLLEQLPVKIFADGADRDGILALYQQPFIRGLTTNPTLMRKVGITDYEAFARSLLEVVKDKPISFEVFSDEFPEMRRQALKISGWQENVYVKIPIKNTRGDSAIPLIKELSTEGARLNITAILTLDQVQSVAAVLTSEIPAVVSVFAGRVADTGVDPMPLMREALSLLVGLPRAELLWASVREVLNIFQAARCHCHIVTVPHDILAKAAKLAGMDLSELSLDTVRMFHADAAKAGYRL